MNSSVFARKLLRWYPLNKRDLPWRNTKDPYIIWLSEIILQQTRVAQGLPYFNRFINRFPSIEDLAAAPLDEVLRLWQGLGYYSRARNLHACAQDIVNNRRGQFPTSYKELLTLKGVGNYTAAAIASFAFGEKVAVVDGNVYRVLARYFGLAHDIGSSLGKKTFERLANEVMPDAAPDEYNQAIMEFGALQCVPKNPACNECPLAAGCFAFRQEMVAQLPLKENKVKVSQRAFLYFHVTCGNRIWVKQRGPKDIWQGLVDFPLEELESMDGFDLNHSRLLAELQAFKPTIDFDPEKKYKHILTHQKIFSNFVRVLIPQAQVANAEKWALDMGYFPVNEDQLEELGKPILIVKYLRDQK